jgi:hypothetical protein
VDRITAIRKSLAVFVFGLIGLLPVVGVVPAGYAVWFSIQVGSKYRNQWNPASAYIRCGAVLGLLGLSCSVLIIVIVLSGLLSSGFD